MSAEKEVMKMQKIKMFLAYLKVSLAAGRGIDFDP